ncbi:MAG: hypothetical protein M3022_09380 [Actinomycetota bacterium]|nr:hypothetical protein [Actinomycetota bacterium]
MTPHDNEPTERPIIDEMLEQIKAPVAAGLPATVKVTPAPLRLADRSDRVITGAGVAAAGVILALGAASRPPPPSRPP